MNETELLLQRRADKMVSDQVFCHVGALIEALSAADSEFYFENFDYTPSKDEILAYVRDTGGDVDVEEDREDAPDNLEQMFEPLEYWAVSDWLADRLRERDEVVAEIGLTYVWARTTSGQAIAIDGVIERIVRDTEYAITMGEDQDTIAIKWNIEDVREVAPDLDINQQREVLRRVKDHHDATVGVNWDVLQEVAAIVRRESPKSPNLQGAAFDHAESELTPEQD